MASDLSRRKFLGAAAAVAAGAGTLAAAEAPQAPAAGKAIKIVALSCSPHKGGATAASLRLALDGAKEVAPNVEIELIELGGMKLHGSVAAGIELAPGEKDDFLALMPKLADPQVRGIIVGTPVYFSNMSSLCKEFIERCMAFRKDNFALKNKVAGVVAVGGGRNGGQELTIQSVQAGLFGQQLIIVGQAPPSGHGGASIWNEKSLKGDIAKNEQNVTDAKALGRRVAEVALALAGSAK
jgi:multimeric flavodoxin WrbA